MDNNELLRKYKELHFPGLRLGAAFYYLHSVGIRFDLHGRRRRMSRAYDRAQTLFEATNAPADTIFLVAHEFYGPGAHFWASITCPAMYRIYLHDVRLAEDLSCAEIPNPYSDEGLVVRQYCLRCRVTDLNYRDLLVAIANQEIGPPSVHSSAARVAFRCFFINASKDTALHLYDDRGLDIVADKASALLHIYREYNSWILDSDRERTDATFA